MSRADGSPPPAENRTLCRARALGKRVSVFSPRARTPTGGRSRCVFAKQIRGFSAQSLSPMQMRCRSDCSLPCPASTSPQAENPSQNSGSDWDAVSGRRLKRKLHPGIDARNGIHFPDGASSGNCNPESSRRAGRAFPTAAQAESSSRNPRSDRDALSASPAASKNLRALHPKTG